MVFITQEVWKNGSEKVKWDLNGNKLTTLFYFTDGEKLKQEKNIGISKTPGVKAGEKKVTLEW